MAINCYTGLMGSGKSYEVVSSVILPAVLEGRRVVTNIDGINPGLIYDYVVERRKGIREQLGEIVPVKNEDVQKPGFFPDETKPEQPSIVHGGDLVCIDECWNFWAQEHKISDEHMRFFRMHRHYTHKETGVSCDLVLMIQDLATLNRKLRAVIEMTTRTVKLKSLGMPTNYRIELYETNKITKKTHLDTFNKSYKKEIFPLYKSYAAGNGKEKAIDKRQNILLNPRLWLVVTVTVALLAGGSYQFWRFLHPAPPKDKTEQAKAAPAAPNSSNPPAPSNVPLPSQQSHASGFSDAWRIAGRYVSASGEHWMVVVNAAGKLRIESPSVFHNQGYAAIGQIDGERVTVWSGATSGGMLGAVEGKK